MKEQVSAEVKRERSERLIFEAQRIADEAIRRHVEKRASLPAVIANRAGEYWCAHSDSYVELRVSDNPKISSGMEALITVIRIENNIAYGEIITE